MTQHHDQPYIEFSNRILDASLHESTRTVDYVSGHADHEEISHTLIENQFRRNP